MNKIKKGILGLLTCLLCFQLMSVEVFAAGVSVSANASRVTIGSSFKVNVSANDCYATIHATASNGSISGGSGDVDSLGSSSTSFTVKPNGVGTCTVTVRGTYAAYSGSSADVSFSKTVSVTVNEKATSSGSSSNTSSPQNQTPAKTDERSKENALASLTVSEGTLSPAFSAGTTEYSVSLESSKTKISIQASAKDSKAKVSGTGEKTLEVGSNKFEVICIAENGSKKIYIINVHVDETPTVFTEYDSQKLGVVKNLKDVKIPTSFDETTTKLNEEEVISWYSQDLKLMICYLSDESGNKDFYVVEDGKVSYKYTLVKLDGKNYIVLPISTKQQKREGFIYQEISIEDQKMNGWLFKDETMKNYVQVYLMNEHGEKSIYNYETTEGQLQKYTELEKKESFNIFIVTTLLFMGVSGALGYLYLRLKKKSIVTIQDNHEKQNQ